MIDQRGRQMIEPVSGTHCLRRHMAALSALIGFSSGLRR
jgi:hypothetical protein